MEEEYRISHKIEAGKKYRVFKSTYNDNVYYKIRISQKDFEGNTKKYYIRVFFRKGIELPDGTDIIIKKAIENYRDNPKDEYNGISCYVITDFDIVEAQEIIQKNAMEEYSSNLSEQENSANNDYDYELPF